MSIAIKVHNDFATFSNSVSKRQFQMTTADLKLIDNGDGTGSLHLRCIPIEINPDREFSMSASFAECQAAFDAMAQWNELRTVELLSAITLWDVGTDSTNHYVYTYPKA